ncbi:MAG: response regulator [Vicinamibacterales bacterium]
MHSIAVRRATVDIDTSKITPAAAPVALLVTPDRHLREAAARALEGDGYKVLSASHSGHAVLACLEAGYVDVAAIELSMDDISGPALTERLRRRCPAMRAIFFARSGTPECEGVLVRPFTRDDLLSKIGLSLVALEPEGV